MTSGSYNLTHLKVLEAESIHIIREVAAEFERPVMLYSIGKDSAVMLRLAQKAFHPGRLPVPLLHVDTTWKFREMIEFRDRYCREQGLDLKVWVNPEGRAQNINPFDHGSKKHTDIMKTAALKQALNHYQFDAAFGGARRDEEKSRAKERVYSFRDRLHQWDPKNQRPELWNLYNCGQGRERARVPTVELDGTRRVALHRRRAHSRRPSYFAQERGVWSAASLIVPEQPFGVTMPGEKPQMVKCRMRSLGCSPCTGASRSYADTVPKIIDELIATRQSERQLRIIDHDQDGSMEIKKREGYF
jgi:sulfate adenylyltransferase subunit 2